MIHLSLKSSQREANYNIYKMYLVNFDKAELHKQIAILVAFDGHRKTIDADSFLG